VLEESQAIKAQEKLHLHKLADNPVKERWALSREMGNLPFSSPQKSCGDDAQRNKNSGSYISTGFGKVCNCILAFTTVRNGAILR